MYAIAEFGSNCRNESDSLSDKDLLVVSPYKQRSELYKRYSELGYSVTLLSENQLRAMQAKGSLFIQHLKHESRVLYDFRSEFFQFINGCQLKRPSEAEIRRCIRSLDYISGCGVPSYLNKWKADFLYCISRDYLIKIIAKEGVVAFGIDGLETSVTNIFGLESNSFSLLRELRIVKSSYRDGRHVSVDIPFLIFQWLLQLSKISGVDFRSNNDPVNFEDLNGFKSKRYNSQYEKLRTLEALYTISQSSMLYHSDHERLLKFITDPNLYRSSQVSNRSMLDMYYMEVLALLANKSMNLTLDPATERGRRPQPASASNAVYAKC